MTVANIALLIAAAFGAGVMNSVAGGGSFLTFPALVFAGVPSVTANATNTVAMFPASLTAAWAYRHDFPTLDGISARSMLLISLAGGASGALLLILTPEHTFNALVPWLLLGIAVYVLLSPGLGKTAAKARLKPVVFAFLAGGVLGFYDGFFGPGTGAFWALACISLLGLELTRATAFTKVVNLASNMASLIIFVFSARVHYEIAFVMIAGQLIGGRLGASMAIRHGAPFIRIIFVTVVFVMVTKLLWDQFS